MSHMMGSVENFRCRDGTELLFLWGSCHASWDVVTDIPIKKHRQTNTEDQTHSSVYRIVNLCSLKITPSDLKMNCDQNYINTSDLVITSLFAYGLVCLKSTPITRCKLFFMFNVLCQHCQPILVYSMSHVRKPWLIVIYDLYDHQPTLYNLLQSNV